MNRKNPSADRFLLSTDRKQIRKLHFKSVDEIKERVLKYYFKQALALQNK